MAKQIGLLWTRVKNNELIQGSFFVFIASTLASFFSFVLNFFLTRHVSAADYGIYASLLSLLALASIPIQSLPQSIIQYATTYFAHDDIGKAKALYQVLTKFIVSIAVVTLVLFVIFAQNFQAFLKLPATYYIVWIGSIIGVSYLGIVNTAFLQSLLKFKTTSLLNLLGAFLKLSLGIMFILFGMRIAGLLFVILFTTIIPYLLSFFPLRFIFLNRAKSVKVPIKEICAYAIPAGLGLFAASSFTSTDILLVKHFFTPEQAGLYSGLSLVGKIIFYFTSPISVVMYPLIIKRNQQKGKINNLFFLSIFLVGMLSFGISLFYFLFPEFVIRVVLGKGQYLILAPYIGIFGVYLSAFSILNIFVLFFLSLKKMIVSYILFVGAIAQVILISLFHQNFYQVIFSSLGITILLLVVLLLYYAKYGSSKKEETKKSPALNHYSRV